MTRYDAVLAEVNGRIQAIEASFPVPVSQFDAAWLTLVDNVLSRKGLTTLPDNRLAKRDLMVKPVTVIN